MVTIPTTITGGAQTGFTSPTYTTSPDSATDTNAKQAAVTALGGTQVGVTLHTVSSPFLLRVTKPKSFAVLGKPNPTTGLIADVPMNKYRVSAIKGVTPLAGQPVRLMAIDGDIRIPAGAETNDPSNVRAAIAAFVGLVNSISAGLGDTVINGVL